jgi:hypothetical protein
MRAIVWGFSYNSRRLEILLLLFVENLSQSNATKTQQCNKQELAQAHTEQLDKEDIKPCEDLAPFQ